MILTFCVTGHVNISVNVVDPQRSYVTTGLVIHLLRHGPIRGGSIVELPLEGGDIRFERDGV
jgi:hypothetical protein